MADFIQLPVVQALAWALVHFLWQGAAIGLAALLTFRLVRMSARARYAIGVGALVAMIVAPVATFLTLAGQPIASPASSLQTPATVGHSAAEAAAIVWSVDVGTAAVTPSLRVSPDVLAGAVLAWFAGVAFFSVRLFGGWIVARRMARLAVRPASESIQALARHLADRLQVHRVVMVLESSVIAVPVMVGWLKPAVVLPMAALAGLSPAQMEALLAHELAHVRRHDYLVNLLQSLAEALLFYHPAVWWLSRRVRAERELCCDDLAVGVCDRLVYATALTDLAAMTSPRIALAATDGDLLSRVRRILGQTDAAPGVRAGVMPVLALALALAAGAAVSVAFASAGQAPASKPSAVPQSVESPAISSPATVTLQGEVSARVESSRPAELAFDSLAVAQTPEQQAERRRQVEEARRQVEDLRKVLEQLEAQLKAQRDQQPNAQMAEQYQKSIDQYKMLLVQIPAGEQRGYALQGQVTEEYKKALEQSQAATNAELVAARQQWEDAKKRFEVGLISEQQLREVEAAVKRLQERANPEAQAGRDLGQAVREAETQLARIRALFEKGLMTQQQVREAEMALAQAQAGGSAEALTAVQLREAQAQLERAKALFDKGLTTQQSVADREAALKALAERLRETQREVRPESAQADRVRADMEAKLNDLLAMLRAQSGEMVVDAEVRGRVNLDANLRPVADAAELVKAGDVLRIIIEGEPDLPNTFQVTADGAIRMPFLGSIKVVGLTSANVRAAVGKLLSDRKLGSPAQVKVTLMRSGRVR